MWELTWGSEYETLKEIQRETGITPKSLLDRPALRASHRHYLEAFYELSAGRSIGEVAQPITISAFKDYCELYGIASESEREHLHRLIRRLDAAFLREMARRQKQELDKAKRGAGR